MNNKNMFLPITKEEMKIRGWEQPDFILITADAYVDHPSFANGLIGRLLEAEGYRVALMPQPDWNDPKAFRSLGKPKHAFLVSGGNIDSMVNHYTVSKKRRKTDSYSPGGKGFLRPDRPVIVYSNKVREVYKDVPIIIGGIEASLRRFAHYDYWQDKLRHSVLFDAQADLLVYGMGEKSLLEIAGRLAAGEEVSRLTNIQGTCYLTKDLSALPSHIVLPSFGEISKDKKEYARSVKIQYEEQNPFHGAVLAEEQERGIYLVQNPPQEILSRKELDRIYSLPFLREPHPSYEEEGGVPAISEVKFSVVSERGCFGGCNFCSLAFHQGRVVSSRSEKSIINEIRAFPYYPDFKGYVHDVGGPTANFRFAACKKQETHGACKNRQCLFPEPCPNLKVSHQEYLNLLRKIKELPGIKKVFIRSGIRYDYLMKDQDQAFFKELVKDHVSGQLKVAPEHCSPKVLKQMGKPDISVFNRFRERFYAYSKEVGKEQYLVPYLMSSHPGSTLTEAVRLAEFLRDMNYQPEQVQDFYPTPGTLSTCMYYTGLNPITMEPVYVPKSAREKSMQRALLQYRKKENYPLVKEALKLAGREDLIGFDKKCFIKPSTIDRRPKENERKDHRRKTSLSKHKRKTKK